MFKRSFTPFCLRSELLLLGCAIALGGALLGMHRASLAQLPSGSRAVPAAIQQLRQIYRRNSPLGVDGELVYQIDERQLRVAANEGRSRILTTRLYRPSAAKNLPALIYFHGGGFVAGDLESHDWLLRQLANRSQTLIIAVDYGLAPEHPFPQGMEDGYRVLTWAVEKAQRLGLNPQRIGVGGDGAGGAIAAGVARLSVQRQGPKLNYQALLYPTLDATLSGSSWQMADPVGLSRREMAQNYSHYLPPNSNLPPTSNLPPNSNLPPSSAGPDAALASLALAPALPATPPALVITAEWDPARDDGETYAQGLKQANIPVLSRRYPQVGHNFLQQGQGGAGVARGLRELADFIRAEGRTASPTSN